MARDPVFRDRYYPQQIARIHERARSARLTPDEFGVFRFLIDLMWLEGGPLEDNPRWLAGQINSTTRRCNKILGTLKDRGLITIGDGFISDVGTNDAIVAHRRYRDKQGESGRRGGEAKARNLALQAEKDQRRVQVKGDKENREGASESLASLDGNSLLPLDSAFVKSPEIPNSRVAIENKKNNRDPSCSRRVQVAPTVEAESENLSGPAGSDLQRRHFENTKALTNASTENDKISARRAYDETAALMRQRRRN